MIISRGINPDDNLLVFVRRMEHVCAIRISRVLCRDTNKPISIGTVMVCQGSKVPWKRNWFWQPELWGFGR